MKRLVEGKYMMASFYSRNMLESNSEICRKSLIEPTIPALLNDSNVQLM
jgi:hypothetical protein